MNQKRRALIRGRLATKRAVSRNFNLQSDDRIKDLMQVRLKPNSESKVNWAVTAYNEWREFRLETFNYDVGIYYADLNDLANLTRRI